jgi:hypothetical protein
MKKLILSFLLILVSGYSHSQVTFNHLYDFDESIGTTVFRSMIATSDGGYALTGSVFHTPWSEVDTQGNEVLNYTSDVILVKTDSAFHVQWTKIYYSLIDFSYEESGVKIKEKSTGGYIILAETEDPQEIYYNGRPANVLSTNASGTLLWSRSFLTTTGYDKPFDFIIDDTDNSIVVAGSTNFTSGSRKPWAFKMDSTGHLLWGNTYTATNGEFRSIVKAVSGEGYVLAGKRSTDVMLMRMNSSGNNIWTRTYTTAASEGAQTLIRSGSGYAILVNNITSGSCQLLQTDSGGTTTSVKSYPQLSGISLNRTGSSFHITGNQGSSSVLSFTADLSGTITSTVRSHNIPSFTVTSNETILKERFEYICGAAASQGWVIKADTLTGYAGGCFTSQAAITAQNQSFTFATINPSVNNLFMEEDVESFMVDELIYINQYILCSCSPAQAAIISSPAQFCSGSSAVLHAFQSPDYQYAWFRDEVLLTGENASSLVISLPGSYTVSVTGACDIAVSSPWNVVQIPSPVINKLSSSEVRLGDTLLVTGTGLNNVVLAMTGDTAGLIHYNDTLLGVVIPDEASGDSLTLINASGCSASQFITVDLPPEIELHAFIEGFYNGDGSSVKDTITISLFTPASPPVQLFTAKIILSREGLARCTLPYSLLNQMLYLSIRHRNSMETWSRAPLLINNTVIINFSSN